MGAFPAQSAGNRAIQGSAIAPAAAQSAAAAPRPSYPLRGSVFGAFFLKIIHIFKRDGIPVRRGLIFDMDGTLYTHAEYLASQTELPLRRLAQVRGKSYEAMKAEFDAYRAAWEREHRGRAGEEKISMGNAFRAFGISIEENVRWREELYRPEQYLRQDPRLRETLLRLSGDGAAAPFLLAVLTNNPVSVARRTLRCLGVEDCFSAIIGLDTCMVSKPHRLPFQRAAESLGLSPERCVSIGDRWEIDIALPLEMGMGGILVEGVEDVYGLPEILLPD